MTSNVTNKMIDMRRDIDRLNSDTSFPGSVYDDIWFSWVVHAGSCDLSLVSDKVLSETGSQTTTFTANQGLETFTTNHGLVGFDRFDYGRFDYARFGKEGGDDKVEVTTL